MLKACLFFSEKLREEMRFPKISFAETMKTGVEYALTAVISTFFTWILTCSLENRTGLAALNYASIASFLSPPRTHRLPRQKSAVMIILSNLLWSRSDYFSVLQWAQLVSPTNRWISLQPLLIHRAQGGQVTNATILKGCTREQQLKCTVNKVVRKHYTTGLL